MTTTKPTKPTNPTKPTKPTKPTTTTASPAATSTAPASTVTASATGASSDARAPGSREAAQAGCVCSPLLNTYGAGLRERVADEPVAVEWFVDPWCPRHGTADDAPAPEQ